MAGKVIDCRGEPPPATFLNQFNFSQPLSKKLLFATDRDRHRKPQLVRMQRRAGHSVCALL